MKGTIFAAILIAALAPTARGADSLAALARRGPPLPGIVPQSRLQLLTVPAETEASVELLSGIHTRVSHVDDPVEGRLLQPVYVGGQVALPSGSLLYGRITQIRSAGRMHRPAQLAFRFEQITLPDGQTEPVAAVLASLDGLKSLRLDREGYLQGGRGISLNHVAGGLVGLGALATVGVKLGGAAMLGPLLPAGGAVLLGYELLWPRGADVHLPPETRCRIRLDYPLTVHQRSVI